MLYVQARGRVLQKEQTDLWGCQRASCLQLQLAESRPPQTGLQGLSHPPRLEEACLWLNPREYSWGRKAGSHKARKQKQGVVYPLEAQRLCANGVPLKQKHWLETSLSGSECSSSLWRTGAMKGHFLFFFFFRFSYKPPKTPAVHIIYLH